MQTPSRSLVLHSWYVYTAAVLIVAVLAWATGLAGFFIRNAQAAPLTNLTDTLSTSAPGSGANHTIRFTTPTGIPATGQNLAITFPSGFDVSSITENDVDIADDGVDLTTAPSCGASQAGVNITGQTITIEICGGGGGAIGASSVVTVEVGTNATSSGTGVNKITNHSVTGSYELSVVTSPGDTGYTRIVVLDQVSVSAAVDGSFSFTIAGVNAGQSVNGDAVTTVATTTATSVPFGSVQPNTPRVLAQDISVLTNSTNGFMVTVNANGDLTSVTGATINSFTDGTGVSTPATWASPSGTYNSPDTYGHWGVTTEDATLSDNDSFGSALYAGNFINNPREVMYGDSPADGVTANIGKTRVGYKLETSVMQEAASDYSTTLTYVATPVF